MLKPRCLGCGDVILLDKSGYSNYAGSVECPHCGFMNHMVFDEGHLLTARAAKA